MNAAEMPQGRRAFLALFFQCVPRNRFKVATEKRREKSIEPIGAPWQWVPGNSPPPQDTKKASGNSATRQVRILEILFADETTLLSTEGEMQL